jgi:replication-associated recombination protein RarA
MILYGREGVGKMTLLKSIACAMNMEIHVCSNELDRFKYLKDKDESTKSECVKIRKGTPTPSVLLTSFFNKK